MKKNSKLNSYYERNMCEQLENACKNNDVREKIYNNNQYNYFTTFIYTLLLRESIGKRRKYWLCEKFYYFCFLKGQNAKDTGL